MKRLLVYTENYARGGGNRYLIDFTNSASSFEGTLTIASNPGGIYQEDIARLKRPAHCIELPVTTRGWLYNVIHTRWLRRLALPVYLLVFPVLALRNIWLLDSLLRSVKPDLVICCNGGYPGGSSVLLMTWLAGRRKLPCVLSIVSTPRQGASNWLSRFIDRSIWQSVDCVTVNAVAVRDALVHERGLPIAKACVLYNCLEDRAPLPRKDGPPVFIGCISRMDFSKGVRELLDAFSRLATRDPDIRLILAGQGDASDWLAGEVSARGLTARVQLLGHWSGPVDELLSKMNIFVLPSWQEGFPYCLLEAMRAEIPIVATDVGGIPEAVEDGISAIIVPPKNSDRLVIAIEHLVKNVSFRHLLAGNARKRFLERFSDGRLDESVGKLFTRHDW